MRLYRRSYSRCRWGWALKSRRWSWGGREGPTGRSKSCGWRYGSEFWDCVLWSWKLLPYPNQGFHFGRNCVEVLGKKKSPRVQHFTLQCFNSCFSMSFPSICKSNLTSHFISSYSIKSLQATNSLLRSSSSSSLISTPPSNLSRSPSHLFPIPKPLSKPSINIQKSRFMTSNSISASKIHFSSFDVTSQVFFSNNSKSVHGIVNLKPIVPCHVLLIPKKCYKSFSEVPLEEVAQLFQSVQLVSSVLKRELKADALTISIQDGEEAVSAE